MDAIELQRASQYGTLDEGGEPPHSTPEQASVGRDAPQDDWKRTVARYGGGKNVPDDARISTTVRKISDTV